MRDPREKPLASSSKGKKTWLAVRTWLKAQFVEGPEDSSVYEVGYTCSLSLKDVAKAPEAANGFMW